MFSVFIDVDGKFTISANMKKIREYISGHTFESTPMNSTPFLICLFFWVRKSHHLPQGCVHSKIPSVKLTQRSENYINSEQSVK